MPSAARTVAALLRDNQPPLAWLSKDPLDELDYCLDLSAWLADSGGVLISCVIHGDLPLTVSNERLQGDLGPMTRVVVNIAGGLDGTVPAVSFLLAMADGQQLAVGVKMPVRARVGASQAVLQPPTTEPPAPMLGNGPPGFLVAAWGAMALGEIESPATGMTGGAGVMSD